MHTGCLLITFLPFEVVSQIRKSPKRSPLESTSIAYLISKKGNELDLQYSFGVNGSAKATNLHKLNKVQVSAFGSVELNV